MNTSGGASVMGMFNTAALYHDPLLDNPLYGSSALPGGLLGGAAGSSSGPLRGVRGAGSGQKAAVQGSARRDNFDTASLRSQDDTAR